MCGYSPVLYPIPICCVKPLQPSSERTRCALQVEAAVQHAMQEAEKHEESMHEGIDFNSFLKMLRTNSTDSLDQYDDRMSFAGSYDRLQTLLDKSVRAGDLYIRSAHLDSVAEVA